MVDVRVVGGLHGPEKPEWSAVALKSTQKTRNLQ